jgi:ATP-dependent Clp protease ATP-binding subunit ClpC
MSSSIQKTTLLGYHDKNHEKFGIIESQSLPIFIEERYAPFLITRDYIFTISTNKIITLINNFRALNTFRGIKNLFANILVIPGVIVAILYILRITGAIENIEIINTFVSNKLINLSFWLAVLGIIVLWHDHYRTKSHPTKLPKIHEISAKEISNIKSEGINFGRYVTLETVYFLSENSIELLSNCIENSEFNSLRLFENIISDKFTKEVLNRSELSNLQEEFGNLEIGEHTLPKYNIVGLRNLIVYATEAAMHTESKDIEVCHLVIAFFKTFPVLQKTLQTKKLTIEVLEGAARFLLHEKYKVENKGYFNINSTYYKNGGIAKNLIYGWTFILEHFSSDVNEKIGRSQEIFGIGNEKAIDSLTSTVGKITKNNALIIGEPGTGKSSIIKGLAQRINRGEVPQQLKNKRVVQLDLNGLIARASKEKNLEELIEAAMRELRNAGNTILYIDEIQEIIPAKAQGSEQSVAGIMLPHIIESNFPIVGTINYADYKKYIYSNPSLQNSFDNIELEEMSPDSALQILTAKLPFWEDNFRVYIPIPVLTSGVEYAQRYIHNRKLPDSAVNIIESTCSWAQNNNIKRITTEHVAKAVSIQYGIPVKNIDADESTKLMKLEEKIKSRIIGQDEAVHSIVETLKRARTDIRDPNKPIGVFLFLGATGVGKTYLAKVIAQEYFDHGEDIIRVDMSEYQEISSISKFLDSTSDSLSTHTTVTLIDRIRRNPYSVVLFDEIEKAHPNILNIFLQLFDEGRLTSNSGETVSFRNSIIISTSNIGSRIIMESLQKDRALWGEAKDRALIELRQALSPELFNRFDEIIIFAPHDVHNLTKISDLELQKLAKRLERNGIRVNWDKTIPMLIANRAYEPGLGARPIRRFIQKNIEGKIAEAIISEDIKSGEEIMIKESWINP